MVRFWGVVPLDLSATHGSHLEKLGIPNPQLLGPIQPSSKVMDRKLEKKHVYNHSLDFQTPAVSKVWMDPPKNISKDPMPFISFIL